MAHWRRAHPALSMPDTAAMASQEHIIALYEAMADVTSAMLAAARAENWDVLVTLEATCAAHVTTLQRDEPLAVLSKQQSKRKHTLVTQMLADDGELRRLAKAGMAQLSTIMNSVNTEWKLSKAYGA